MLRTCEWAQHLRPLTSLGTYWGHFARVYTTLREKGRRRRGGSNCPVSEAECGLWAAADGQTDLCFALYLGTGGWDFKRATMKLLWTSLSLRLVLRSDSQKEVFKQWSAAAYANLFIYCRAHSPNLGFIRPAVTKIFIDGNFSRHEPKGEQTKMCSLFWLSWVKKCWLEKSYLS